jgi:4-amino-4-deoxy-L-arabinose transferase-like glycosyltransferase
MLIKKNINHSKYIFWFSILFIWILSTISDRIWWNFYSNTPSWDQADYLNSALDHARALSFLGVDGASDFSSLLDKSPKIPPLASIINGAVIAFAGDAPHQAAWSLSFWNGFLIFNIASWGLYLRGKIFGLFCVLISACSPFLFHLRTDYVLELPLISAITFYLFHLGRWSDKSIGGKWIQLLIATCACSFSLLIKQSSLLVIIPSLVFIFILSFKRDKKFRLQFLCLVLISILSILPWFYHNWIMILSGTYRAVFESAALEGDPSILGFKSIFWYFPYLDNQFGSIIFFSGLSGILLGFLTYIRSFRSQARLADIFNKNNYKWTWIYFNLITSWTFTTFIPNKDERYIACTIPLIVLLLALGFTKWSDWLDTYFKLNSYGLLLIPFLSFLFSNSINKFNTSQNISSKYYPVKDIISTVRSGQTFDKKETVIVVPSTPDINQHNVSYFGRMQGGNILGRQLGQSLSHIEPVLKYSNWIVLAEGDQGSVSSNSLALDKAIRDSSLFIQVREFPREKEGSYTLWRRSSSSLKQNEFHNRFIELANGMEQGPLGIKLIFDEIEIEHMLDGHFQYKSIVRNKALSRISSDPEDVESLWSLSLLKILSNRPSEADIYLRNLELLLPNNPWPSAYRTIVNFASWNPWKASLIADRAHKRNPNYLLKSFGDTSALFRGAFWRLKSASNSIPNAIKSIDEDLSPIKK